MSHASTYKTPDYVKEMYSPGTLLQVRANYQLKAFKFDDAFMDTRMLRLFDWINPGSVLLVVCLATDECDRERVLVWDMSRQKLCWFHATQPLEQTGVLEKLFGTYR